MARLVVRTASFSSVSRGEVEGGDQLGGAEIRGRGLKRDGRYRMPEA